MSTVHVVLTAVRAAAGPGALTPQLLPVPVGTEKAAQTITTTGSSQKSTIAALAVTDVWTVTARDGDVWAKFGPDPTAVLGEGHLILAGSTRDFAVSSVGEKIALKDA